VIVIVLGGGFVNTELRELTEPRVFDYFDYVTLDDGERPLLALLEHLRGERPQEKLVRSFVRTVAGVRYIDTAEPDIPFAGSGHSHLGRPAARPLPVDPRHAQSMHRLWSDGRWNKLTVAHGCYWKKCSFLRCLAGLHLALRRGRRHDSGRPHRGGHRGDRADRIPFRRRGGAAQGAEGARRGTAEAQPRDLVVGQHPLREILHPELCAQLADSGCIAVSGASRWLPTTSQAHAKGRLGGAGGGVTHAFSDAGILVHAYLMYGFRRKPCRTRSMPWNTCGNCSPRVASSPAFSTRFACTVHSPVGQHPHAMASR